MFVTNLMFNVPNFKIKKIHDNISTNIMLFYSFFYFLKYLISCLRCGEIMAHACINDMFQSSNYQTFYTLFLGNWELALRIHIQAVRCFIHCSPWISFPFTIDVFQSHLIPLPLLNFQLALLCAIRDFNERKCLIHVIALVGGKSSSGGYSTLQGGSDLVPPPVSGNKIYFFSYANICPDE